MIDVEATLRDYMAKSSSLSAAFGTRIYAGGYLPAGYEVKTGPAILFTLRGGSQDYTSKIFTTSIQMKMYAETESAARKAAQAVYEFWNDTQKRSIPYARLEDGTLPTLLSEPVSRWPYILAYFRICVHNA